VNKSLLRFVGCYLNVIC